MRSGAPARACGSSSAATSALRLLALRAALAEPAGTPFSPDAASAGRRALRNAALDLVTAADPEAGTALALAQLDEPPRP